MAINAPNVLQRGLLTDYRDAFFNVRRAAEEKVSGAMAVGLPSNKRSELRAHFLPAAHAKYQPYGDPINSADLDTRSFETTNYQYSLKIDWLRADREDDQTGSTMEAARQGGASFGLLPERGLADLQLGTTKLVPYVPNAADGKPAYDGTERYGVATGNIVGGQAFTTQDEIITAIYAGHERFRAFDDPWGEPLLPDSTLESPALVQYPPAFNKAVAEAFNLPIRESASGNAGISNIMMAQHGGRTYILWEWARMTSADGMFMTLTGAKKGFLMQARTAIIESYGDNANSDDARTNATEYVQWEQRVGFGVGEVFGTLKLSA